MAKAPVYGVGDQGKVRSDNLHPVAFKMIEAEERFTISEVA